LRQTRQGPFHCHTDTLSVRQEQIKRLTERERGPPVPMTHPLSRPHHLYTIVSPQSPLSPRASKERRFVTVFRRGALGRCGGGSRCGAAVLRRWGAGGLGGWGAGAARGAVAVAAAGRPAPRGTLGQRDAQKCTPAPLLAWLCCFVLASMVVARCACCAWLCLAVLGLLGCVVLALYYTALALIAALCLVVCVAVLADRRLGAVWGGWS
jgi:hypothetical protein